MLKRIKSWFLERFLPMWAKETVFTENKRLMQRVSELQQKLEKQNAYIEGLEAGMKSHRRVIVNTYSEEKK